MLGKLSFTAAVMDDARREKAETRKFPIDIERAVSCEGNGSAHAPAAATAQCLPPYVTSTRVKVMRTRCPELFTQSRNHVTCPSIHDTLTAVACTVLQPSRTIMPPSSSRVSRAHASTCPRLPSPRDSPRAARSGTLGTSGVSVAAGPPVPEAHSAS